MAITATLKTSGSSVEALGTGSVTTASFTPSNNSLLVIFCIGQPNGGLGNISTAFTIADNLGAGALSYTSRLTQGATGSKPNARVWTAPVTTGSAMTLTFDCGANDLYWCKWIVWQTTGHDTTTPTGATAGAHAGDETSNSFDGAQTITLSGAPATDSYVFAAVAADAASSASQQVSPGSGWTEDVELNPGGSFLGYMQGQERTGSTSTSVDWADVRVSAENFSGVMVALEIKASSGGGVANVPWNQYAKRRSLWLPVASRRAG